MPIIIFIILSLNGLPRPFLLNKITEISVVTHNSCLSLLPDSPKSRSAFSALLCGENVTDDSLKQTLVKSSLIHLFVVSGSHLLLIEEVLVFFNTPWLLRFLLFGIYALACSWQAPIVRALIGLLIKFLFAYRKKHWPADLVVLFAGFLSILLFPDWTTSRSLVMSWLAALALSTVSILQIRNPIKKIFTQSALVYLFMIPTIWGFGSLHPLSVVYNIFLAPLVSLFLFPLAFLCCFFTSLISFFEKSFDFFLWVSNQSTKVIAIEKATALSIETLWGFVLVLHFIIHLSRIHIRRSLN